MLSRDALSRRQQHGCHGGAAGQTRDLHLDSAALEWVVNAYLLAAAAFILLGGEAADRFGARRSSTAGIALFALSRL